MQNSVDNTTDWQGLKTLLDVPKDILITSHRNPDGDAIGSSLGLYHFLIQQGHSIKVAFPSEYPTIFAWMPDADKILIYDLEPDAVKSAIEKSDVIFTLDYNALDRVDRMGELMNDRIMQPRSPTFVMVDHHLFPEPYADFTLSDTTASSTSELIYDFILKLDGKSYLNQKIADCLYTGIVTDTGSFRFSTSPKLFRTVASLLELGIQDYRLQDLIHNQLPEKNLRLLGYCLYSRMEILDEFKTAIITLTKQDYETFDIQRGETEGIVNMALTLKNVHMACFITEQPTIVKLSLRSKGDFDVQEICRQYFKGGGHRNASGGVSYMGLRATVTKIKEILPNYKDKLNEKW